MDFSVREKEVLRSALVKWGKRSQVFMCVEEMAELMKELSKNDRGRSNTTEIAEEIADVEIMLEQMKMEFNIHSSVDIMRAMKIANLEQEIKR